MKSRRTTIGIQDLQPGDIIVSYKRPKPWDLLGRLFHWLVKRYSMHVYGKNCKYPQMDHNKVFAGRPGEEEVLSYVVHWTDPAARYERCREWMLEPAEGYEVHVFRPRMGGLIHYEQPIHFVEVFMLFAAHNGTLYDIFDLPSMLFGLTPYFHGIGKKNLVCSTGARWLLEELVGQIFDAHLPVAQTPPCWPAQYPEYFEQLM